MAKNDSDYTYRLLSEEDRRQTAENLLRDVERQIFQLEDQLAAIKQQGDRPQDGYPEESQLETLKARADRLWGIIEEAKKDE